ncbi:Armadillo-type fold domain containing protein [Pseudohyphozyma bogoriensis]|nr:Armadillo-type fold domain containing protein [Pseudohyphozyma bogoriensis]
MAPQGGEQDPAALLEALELDQSKLQASASAERGEIFLLTWLSGVEKALDGLDNATIFQHQAALTTSLLSLLVPPSLNSTTPTIKPGRPARAIMSRILITLLTRGEKKGLFDLGQTLLKGMAGSDTKGAPEREKEWRVANAWVLGEVWARFGGSVMSLFLELLHTTLKIYRTTSYAVILRTSTLLCLRKALGIGARSLSDQNLKDTVKSLRAGLSDKAGAVVRECAECLLVISTETTAFSTIPEIESLLSLCFRSLETADHVTRRSLSLLIAGLLSATQVEGSGAVTAPVKKKKTTEEEDDDPYPTIGAPTVDTGKKTLLEPKEMLAILSSAYNKSSASRKLGNGLIDSYAALFTALGSSWVEHYYPDILKHLVEEIGCGAAAGLGWSGWNARAAERTEPSKARYDALAARKAVAILLREIISSRLLSEPGQIMAAREVGTLYLKRWPSLLGKKSKEEEVSKQALLIGLEEVSGLLRSLGCAPAAVQDVLLDPLVRLVSHPSHSVQIAAAWALRTFCDVAPTKLSTSLVSILESLNKDLAIISTGAVAEVHRRAVGHAHALASLINLIPHQPLYVSFDLSAKCMSLAIQLLKQSGNHELHISGVEIHVAWIIVGALMSLGPNFVRLHLPQLLILWRNALPKPTSKDASAAQVRGDNEWAFLLHVRECTLGAILSFLRHNSSGGASGGAGLVNEDVGRRLVMLLSNGLAFATSFANSHASTLDQQTPSTSSQLGLLDRDLMLRRRLLQCFVALGQNAATQPFQVTLLTQVVALFSDPEKYTGESALQAAIAASVGTFTTVWDETDGYGFGVTSMMRQAGNDVSGGEGEEGGGERKRAKLNRDLAEAKIEAQLRISILGAAEHDPLVLSERHHTDSSAFELPSPPPPASGLVDAAIELFALYFPLQESNNQAALLQQISNNVRSSKMEKNPGRRMAVLANAITAVLGSLRVIMRTPGRKSIDGPVGNVMRDVIKEALLHPDARLREAAAEGLGRLSSLGGTSFMAAQIQFCVSQVVSNTDPDNRAGCALAFGEIYNHVGGLAAGPVLKTIVDVLLSLSADPHPLVHFNALQALSEVIGSASLAYAPFTNSTLGMLCKLYMQDTHEPEGGSPGSVNLRGDLPAYQAVCRVTDALIGVLGPELQESERVRDLVLILLREFLQESDDGITVEAIKATQHFLIFAPTAMDLGKLIATLRSQLSSTRQPLKVAAVNSVYQLVQRDAVQMSKLGGDGLVQELFALLDDDPSIEGVRAAIMSWLRQTADVNPSGWIDLCQRIMSRSSGTQPTAQDEAANAQMMSFGDEESQGLGLEAEGGARPGAAAKRTTSRWRTQLFALECLHEVFLTVLKSGRAEHFDIARARAIRANRRGLLVNRVADLIKMAFTASTAQVMEIRLEGLVVLRDVIENFSQTRDFDFEEALLLDQYQAPIAAALTPAFAQDSYPEVLASAIQVCAVFVGSGVVKEIEKMGRILKLLTTALEGCRESDMSSLGDVKDLSSTAAVMLKTSIFAAWAQFQTASVRQPYLVDVIKPHLPLLCPLWVASLREYARVRTDPDAASSESGVGGAAFDSVYSGLSRETALPFYERSWPQMLHAVATLLKANNLHMLRAVDGIDSTASESAPLVAESRTSPALFFWVLFGLSYEALCATPPAAGSTSAATVQIIALESLVGLIRPEVSGTALLDTGLFEELCNLCYRLAITEGPAIKAHVMEIALSLASTFAQDLMKKEAGSTNGKVVGGGASLATDSKMIQCLRVATCVLREAVPSSATSGSRPLPATSAAHVALIKSAFSSFADLADIYPPPMREELYSVAFHFYSQLLKDEKTEVDLVGPTLPVLKTLCDRAFHFRNGTLVILPKVLNGMLSACLQNVDDMRGRRGVSASLKTKNNLLASVLLLTGLPSTVKIGQAAVERACFLITQTALAPSDETSTIALHCLTSLLTAAARGSGVVQFCVGQLLPGVIEFIARAAEEDYQSGDPRLVGLAEVLKAFVGVLSGVPEGHRTQSLSILLPVLILLLSPSSSTPPPCHALAISHLVSLASSFSVNFKEANAALGEEQRRVLESSIRRTVGGGSGAREEKREQPKISLKFEF